MAPGFLNNDSEPFYNDGSDQVYDVYMIPADTLHGWVLDPNGSPAARASVIAARLLQGRARLEVGDIWAETRPDGRFTLPLQPDGRGLLVVSDSGIAGVSESTFQPGDVIQLLAWAHVEGVYTINGRPVAGLLLSLSVPDPIKGGLRTPYHYECRTDSEGRYVFDRVIPGRVTLSCRSGSGEGPGTEFSLEPGESQTRDIAVEGVQATAQLHLPLDRVDLDFSHCRFRIQGCADLSTFNVTETDLDWPQAFRGRWYREWIETEPGRRYQEICHQVNALEAYRSATSVYATGLLHLENIPPGQYWLSGTFMDPSKVNTLDYPMSDIGTLRCLLTVPDVTQAAGESFNLGTLHLSTVPRVEVGNMAPDLALFTTSGDPITLSQFRGKYLLLDLGFQSYRSSSYERDYVPVLKKLSRDPGLSILSVDVSWGFPIAAIAPHMKQEIRDLGVTWTLGLADTAYGQSPIDLSDYMGPGHFPGLILLDPEGRIVATKIPLDELEGRVREIMASTASN